MIIVWSLQTWVKQMDYSVFTDNDLPILLTEDFLAKIERDSTDHNASVAKQLREVINGAPTKRGFPVELEFTSDFARFLIENATTSHQRKLERPHAIKLISEINKKTFDEDAGDTPRLGVLNGRIGILGGRHRIFAIAMSNTRATLLTRVRVFANKKDYAASYNQTHMQKGINKGTRRSLYINKAAWRKGSVVCTNDFINHFCSGVGAITENNFDPGVRWPKGVTETFNPHRFYNEYVEYYRPIGVELGEALEGGDPTFLKGLYYSGRLGWLTVVAKYHLAQVKDLLRSASHIKFKEGDAANFLFTMLIKGKLIPVHPGIIKKNGHGAGYSTGDGRNKEMAMEINVIVNRFLAGKSMKNFVIPDELKDDPFYIPGTEYVKQNPEIRTLLGDDEKEAEIAMAVREINETNRRVRDFEFKMEAPGRSLIDRMIG